MPNWLTINILMLSALSLLLSGCAKQQLANQAHIEQEVAEQAQNTTATVEGIIQQAEQNLDKALADQLNFFAPLHIANAQDSLSQARQQLESPPENIKNAALMSAIAANKLIEKAYENKKAVSSHLRDMFAAKKILDELNFPAHYQDEYDDLMEDIKDLIRQFEAGQTREAITEQSELIQDMTELEITILTERHVSPAISFLQKAEDMNAEDYAPISFILAQTEIEHAQDYIQANNRNRIGVENAGKQALLAAQKAYFMAQDVKPLINMLPEESETHVDAIFTSLININDKLSTETLPPQPYKNALNKIEELVTLLQKQNTSLKQQLATSTTELENLKNQQTSTLESPVVFDANSTEPEIFSEPLEEPMIEVVEMEDEPVIDGE